MQRDTRNRNVSSDGTAYPRVCSSYTPSHNGRIRSQGKRREAKGQNQKQKQKAVETDESRQHRPPTTSDRDPGGQPKGRLWDLNLDGMWIINWAERAPN